jgi:hypothetical protein
MFTPASFLAQDFLHENMTLFTSATILAQDFLRVSMKPRSHLQLFLRKSSCTVSFLAKVECLHLQEMLQVLQVSCF